MADDINKSGRPPQNLGFGADAIGRIEKATYHIPKTERDQRSRADTFQTQIQSVDDFVAGGGDLTKNPKMQSIGRNAMNSLPGAQSRIRSSVDARLERGNIQYANQISREYSESAVNGTVREFSENQSIQNRAFGLNGQSHEQLTTRRQELASNIQALGIQSSNIAGSAMSRRGTDPTVMASINGNAAAASGHAQEIAAIDLAMRNSKASGGDPLSKFNALNATSRDAANVLSSRALGQEIKSGGVQINDLEKGGTKTIKSGDIQGAIVTEAKKLESALAALAEAAKNGTGNLDDLRKKAEDTAGNFEKLKQAAAGGAGGMSKGQALGMAGGLINTVTQAGQDVLINQRMGQMANTAGFAGVANQQYDMYKKARGGDIASQLALGQTDDASTFGLEMSRATKMVQAGTIAAGATTAAAGGVEMTEGAADKVVGIGGHLIGNGGASTEEFINGTQRLAQGVATVGVTGSDMIRGVSAGQNQVAGYQASMQAKQAVQAIGAEQMQGLRNMYTGLDVVGQGMGRKASKFIDDSTSQGNLDKMVGANMSPDQFVNAAQIGNEAMGSTFTGDSVFAARNMEKAGFGSTGQNMQRMGALAGAGANNPQAGLESVIAAGMTKGLDSSKSINMMVENTASMVASSAGAAVGIDTTTSAASMLANSTNPNMANKEMAVQQAMTAAEITKSQTTDISTSFTGMANTAGLQKNLSNKGIKIDGTAALALQSIDMQTLKSLQNDPKKASEFFKNQGVNISPGQANAALDVTLTEKQRQILRPGLALNKDLEGLRKRAEAGTTTEQDRTDLGQIAFISKRKGGADEILRELAGAKAPNIAAGGIPAASGSKADTDALRTSGFKQMSEAASSAAGQLEKFGGAMKVFTELTKNYEKGGKKNEDAFSGAGAKMATEFSTSVGLFTTATGDYQKASNAIVKALTSSNGNPIKPKFLDKMNQKKGSKE